MIIFICGIFTYIIFSYIFHRNSYKTFIATSNFLFIDTFFYIILFLFGGVIAIFFCVDPFIYLFALFIISVLIFYIKYTCFSAQHQFYKLCPLFLLISPDFYFAKLSKLNFKQNQETKTKHIKIWNHLNFFISFTLYLLFCLSYFYDSFENKTIVLFFLSFISYRTFSRSIEIILAFFKDIIDSEPRSSSLNSNDRIKLATISYLEIIFNFATLNYLASALYKLTSSLPKYIFTLLKNDSILISDPLILLFKSFGTTTLSDATIDSLFSVLQVLTSLVLVLFALAGYLNNKGDSKKKTDHLDQSV